jgi:hypothetical protein
MNSTRLGGLATFLIGGLGTVAVVWYGTRLGESGGKLIGLGWAVPAAIALVGLVQLVSVGSVPISWKRGRTSSRL